MKLWALGLALVLSLSGINAEAAKRLGGGTSFGKQSSNVTQRQAAPAAPAAPAQGVNNAAAKPAPAAPAPAAAPKRPWGAMLGGLAAGLGLAWLANSLGMGGAFGSILMFGLLALGVMMLVGWFMRNRKPAAPQASPFAFQGAGASPAPLAKPYRAENVGNDASARPWERNSMAFEAPQQPPQGGSMIGSALLGSQTWGVPAGFDSEGFLKSAKSNFVTLQAAWDRSDIPALRAMMTDDMLKEIQAQLSERETHTGADANLTEVVMIEAHLLGIEELPDEYMASVEFSGMIREEPSAGPSPFREVWNMTKSKSGGSGWLVAGVQALQ
ncbi:Tim44-like domain-containing protein [Rhodoferax saidenbachensis]|uniref:Lipid-binding transport protein (Tim44 family) n=1 Tax=Rhodoferax saidenbachensis TaxID=1484693 RepID=A0ABU1ZKV2_9BURK|nr:Tim44-like domain-containing protein [Rhodoferax saidenbachensis]MDR7305576.1 putative lipid-binding transport protein (Tim44 family) [Rhodoferax saidenbachensis]